jgi:dihydroflavonol-4-reductase
MMNEGLPLVIVQTGEIYGPGDDSDLARLLRRYILGRSPVAPTRTAYCWIHAEDAAAGHLLAMEEGLPGRTYLMCGEPATLLRALRLVGRMVGKRRGPLPMPGRALRLPAGMLGAVGWVVPPLAGRAERMRHLAGAPYLGDDAVTRSELGFTARPLARGLPDTVRALLQDVFDEG